LRKNLRPGFSILNPRSSILTLQSSILTLQSSILLLRSCDFHQVRIAASKDRRAQHLRQREIGKRGDEEHQQCLHVFRFQRVEQAAAPGTDEGDVARAQCFLVHREVGAAAHQHHDVAPGRAACFAIPVHGPITDDGFQQVGELHGFFLACTFFCFISRCGQRIAQNERRILC